ncbi:MAG: ATP-binding protein [Phycisphaerales bacterium]|jgi:serine/threonine-protein kinase RsbW|nr:ATP-binding protein [Phycisphaerales bacterium]|tara:strand:- start:1536 stop:2096 length:561 start_codon:yes stop_codon:yes gene_type:complete
MNEIKLITAMKNASTQSASPICDVKPIKIELVSDPMYLCGARELVSCIAHRVGFGDMECSKIALALDEAMCNVIRHGYDKATDRPIWVTIYPHKPDESCFGGIDIIIEDEAKQINPDTIHGRDLEDIKPGGLGVHIMREVMDSVVFEKRETKGMRLKMSKSAPRPDEEPRIGQRSSGTTHTQRQVS